LLCGGGAFLLALVGSDPGRANTLALELFEQRIRPVLVEHCYACHNSSERSEGGLALDFREGLRTGGDSGPVLDLDQPERSLLLKALRHEGELRMPQEGPRLSPEIIADFSRWIALGANDPRDVPPTQSQLAAATSWESIREQRRRWWSFQPLTRPLPPEVNDQQWSDHAVDRFLLAKMENAGLHPTRQASHRTVIRRLYFTLTGLPPTPAEIDEFEADTSPAAYDRLVDRLLASPAFGERWARHWMDWFRYAESHGSEGNPAIPNAWRYRDYLIRALNDDVPYDQLIREHIAGDLLPQPRINRELGINESALGIGHLRFVEHGYAPTDPQEELVRTTENQIDVLSKAVLGLTVACARCHDHKFDPISQRDFYALYGIMTSCRPAQITVDTTQQQNRHKVELRALKREIKGALATDWLESAPALAGLLAEAPRASAPEELQDQEAAKKWSPWQQRVNEAVQQGLSNPLYPWIRLRAPGERALPEVWQELRAAWQASSDAVRRREETLAKRGWDLRGRDLDEWFFHGVGLEGAAVAAGEFRLPVEGDRVVANIYPAGVYSHLLSSKHSAVLTSPDFRAAAGSLWIRALGHRSRARYAMQHYARVAGPIYQSHRLDRDEIQWYRFDMTYWEGDQAYLEFATAADLPVEAENEDRSWFGVTQVAITDAGQPPPLDEPAEFISPLMEVAAGRMPDSADQVAAWYVTALERVVRAWRDDQMTDAEANFLGYFVRHDLLPNTLSELPAVAPLVARYRQLEAEVPVPTRAPGVLEAQAHDERLMVRGSHQQRGDVVPRGFLEFLDPAAFETAGSGRLDLAERLVDPANPLTTRVIVNRVWHYVFGRGIVASADNFGRLGDAPTHPELLDYLAERFVADGYSLKKLIRLLVTSRAFGMDSAPTAASRQLDSENRLLSHMRVRRLEAEAIRDAILAVSGRLDRKMYGAPEGDPSARRSVYVAVRRNELNPFLAVFDAPAPFSTTGRRDATNVPAQSLAMMNDAFVRESAIAWSNRLSTMGGLDSDAARIDYAFRGALGRSATSQEKAATLAYLKQLQTSGESEPRWCDVLQAVFAFKEFIYLP
jgi:hypothetical protein